ncbi:MAG TPA: hypothetical protein VIU64_03880 [Polyangia bacterium]
MKNRDHFGTVVTILMTTFGAAPFVGCGGPAEAPAASAASSEALAAIVACGLDDGTIERDAHLGACDPQDTKKTTICHVPPGNPANAHTICVGSSAVPHHMKNHGDLVGACQAETMCPPPPPPPPSCDDGHGHGKGGASGDCGAGGHGGQPDPVCPDGQSVCGTADNQCPEDVGSCVSGCCVPWTKI